MHPTWVSFRSPKSTMISRWLRRAGIGRRCERFSKHLNRKRPEPRWRAPASGRLEMGRRAGTMARPLDIAIVGAGMGGLATAAALRRVGITVTVYEQAQQFTRLGAGIQIGCNAMKVLRKLGLEQRMRGGSFYPRSWNNRDWKSGDVKFDMIFGESAEEKFGAPYLLAHRGDLHAALASAVPDECLKLGHKLIGLDETKDGVKLTFANGATAVADAVVGADGVHSIVRDILFGQ